MEPINFFSQLATLNLKGDLQIIIRLEGQNQLVVSTWLNNTACTDPAKALITPFNMTGTPEELDRDYIQCVTTPMQTASGLQSNMESYMQQIEAARKNTAAEKDKADRERKEKDLKEKVYKECMKKADELEKEGRYREAWIKVPEPADYPELAAILRKRKAALSVKFQPDLWAIEPASEKGKEETLTESLMDDDLKDDDIDDGEVLSDQDDDND